MVVGASVVVVVVGASVVVVLEPSPRCQRRCHVVLVVESLDDGSELVVVDDGSVLVVDDGSVLVVVDDGSVEDVVVVGSSPPPGWW